jgi:LPS O-antigen subunit length determinant protein (WzzB/FepE family)
MALIDVLIGPIASIIDKIIPDKEARAKAKIELLTLQGTQEMQMLETQLKAIVARAIRTIRGPAARARAFST